MHSGGAQECAQRSQPALVVPCAFAKAKRSFAAVGAAAEELTGARVALTAAVCASTWDRLRGCAEKVTRPNCCTPPLSGFLRHPE